MVEVNRPDRQLRRRHGRTDTIDAEAATRSVLNGHAQGLPKSHDGIVESIRLHRLTLTTLRKSRTALIDTLRAVLVTAPSEIRDELEALTQAALFTRCARLRVQAAPSPNPTGAVKQKRRTLARHIRELDTGLARLRAGLTTLAESANPELMATRGVGIDSACAVLVAAGDNPRSKPLPGELSGIDSTAGVTVKPTAPYGASP